MSWIPRSAMSNGTGGIRRLTVSVGVDYKNVTAEDGKVSREAQSQG